MTWGMVAVAGASLVGGVMSSNAAGDAADAQTAAANQANETQRYMYDQSRLDQAPWNEVGTSGLNALATRLGLAQYSGAPLTPPSMDKIRASFGTQYQPQAQQQTSVMDSETGWPVYSNVSGGAAAQDIEPLIQAEYQRQLKEYEAKKAAQGTSNAGDPNFNSLMKTFTNEDFVKDPGYQFRLDEGQKALQRSAAARGGLLSGAALKATSRYGQDYASNEFQNAFNRDTTNKTNIFNRLASVSGVGQTAANQNSQNAMMTGNNIAQNQIGAGNARASGYMGQANAITGSIGQGINYFQNQQYMNKLPNRGGVSNPFIDYPVNFDGSSWG